MGIYHIEVIFEFYSVIPFTESLRLAGAGLDRMGFFVGSEARWLVGV